MRKKKNAPKFLMHAGLVGMLLAAGCTPVAGGDAYVRSATRALAAGKYSAALTLFEKAAACEPKNAAIVSRIGYVYYRMGDRAAAEAAYVKAIALDTACADAYVNLGALHFQEGLFTKSEAELREAVSIAPESFDARVNLGHVLYEKGDYAGAGDAFDAAFRLRPTDPVILCNRAIVAVAAQDLPTAINLLERALKIKPAYTAALELMAIVQEQQGNPSEAVRYWQRRAATGAVTDPMVIEARKRYRRLLVEGGAQ